MASATQSLSPANLSARMSQGPASPSKRRRSRRSTPTRPATRRGMYEDLRCQMWDTDKALYKWLEVR